MPFPASQPPGPGLPSKVAIPRLARQPDDDKTPGQRRSNRTPRVSMACTGCRARKIRCNGAQPRCQNCLAADQSCSYPQGRRDRFKISTQQNQDMIAMLEDLKGRATEHDRELINDLLAQVSDNVSEAASSLNLSDPFQDGTQGEADTSAEVGSNGGMDVLEEDVLQTEASRATGFVGKSSEVRWLRRLQQDTERLNENTSQLEGPYGPPGDSAEAALQRTDAWTQRQRQDSSVRAQTSASTFYLDSNDTEVNRAVNPFELPPRETAQRLLDGYIATVQDSFPVLSETVFKHQFEQYYTSMLQGIPSAVSHKWLTILNLVFAIGAKYWQLIEADLQTSSQDHHTYWSRAHVLGLDGSSLVAHPDLMQIQITALVAFYFLCVGHVNRAWVVIGSSLRYAHALGLHVRNEDRTATISKKETLLRIWWSLYSIDRILSTIVGRPSFVIEEHCSVPLPLPLAAEQLLDEALAHQFHERYRGAELQHDTPQTAWATDEPSNAGSFLKANVQIGLITQNAMARLYSAKVVTDSWKQAQQAITSLSEQLEAWLASLPSGLNLSQSSFSTSLRRERFILQMQYAGAKILITRPCLCRLDRRIVEQSKTSDNFNNQIARSCVRAAMAVTDLLPEEVDTTYLYQIGPWWSIVHNLMQALVVLMLEMSYCSAHFSREGKQILAPIKKLLHWLRIMSIRDDIADRAYNMAFGVLQGLASKLNVDVSEFIREDTTQAKHPIAFHSENQQSAVGSHAQENILSPIEHAQIFGEQGMCASGFYGSKPGYASMFEVPTVQPQNSPWMVGSTGAGGAAFPDVSHSDSMLSNSFVTGYEEENPVISGKDLFGAYASNSRFRYQ
ncbi:unnamed protein product [Periconia digitata]|uniref:Zn(2)-C6 fungal-type domain-containing protein n=1 Tax=Periconia digitata TaxID=1303443 RepID=A0A9W4UNB5_9PLEO|nr:unnamed protein product [Periconia digitata]